MNVTISPLDLEESDDDRVLVETPLTETVCDAASMSTNPDSTIALKCDNHITTHLKVAVDDSAEVKNAVRRARQYGETATFDVEVLE